jgi:hypothetical protein
VSEPAVVDDDAHSWRETLLQRLLITTTPLVVAGVAMAIAATSGSNRLTFLLMLPAVTIQVLAIFRRKWPYALRAWLLRRGSCWRFPGATRGS